MIKYLSLLLLFACTKEAPEQSGCYTCTTVVTTYKLNGIVSRGTTVVPICNPDSARAWEKEQQGRDTNLMGWVTVKETKCNLK